MMANWYHAVTKTTQKLTLNVHSTIQVRPTTQLKRRHGWRLHITKRRQRAFNANLPLSTSKNGKMQPTPLSPLFRPQRLPCTTGHKLARQPCRFGLPMDKKRNCHEKGNHPC